MSNLSGECTDCGMVFTSTTDVLNSVVRGCPKCGSKLIFVGTDFGEPMRKSKPKYKENRLPGLQQSNATSRKSH